MLQVNQVRGDEFLSFLHSDPEQFDLLQVFQNIHNGADHSYLHAGFVWMAFKLFGYQIVVQRGVSMFFWLLSGGLLYVMMRKWNWSSLQISVAIALIMFSNLGIFLATDGRFYAMVFCIVANEIYTNNTRMDCKTFHWLVYASIAFTIGITHHALVECDAICRSDTRT
jgi:hypothetical protein